MYMPSPYHFPARRVILAAMQLMGKESASRCRLRASSTFASKLEDQRVYVLGIGNVGKLFAHSLASKTCPPPITLVLHRKELAREWEESGMCIELIANGISNKQHLYDIEILVDDKNGIASPEIPIANVIVATKATRTTAALTRIKNRLNEDSTILFTQNGMGMKMVIRMVEA